MARINFDTGTIQIVVNPIAGNGKANKIAKALLHDISSFSGSRVNLIHTEKANDATTITREAIKDGAGLIITVGGDGTINEVVNGFFIDGYPINPDCELGIISCGTGKGFGNSLRLPRSVEQQIELLFNAKAIPIDVGRIMYHELSGEPAYRMFINECQTGIGSKVASMVGQKQKILGGSFAFGITATIQAILMKPLLLNIEFDNEPVEEFNLIGLVTGNGTECAGGMKLTPDAKMNDGLFDVLLIHEMSVIKRLFNLTKVYSGSHISSPYFTIKRCKKLKIRSDIQVSLEADGEMLGVSPFDIELMPAGIKIKTGFN